MKRLIALLLLTALMTAAAAGCSDSKQEAGAVTIAQQETEADTAEDIYDDLPTGSYDGYEFRVLNNESNFALTQFDSEALDGEAINDAVYERNRKIEDRLGIVISENMVSYSVVNSTMDRCLAAAEDAYDIFFNEVYFVTPYATQGYLYNIYDISSLSLEKPWWNSDVIDSLTIGSRLYVLCGELHFMLQESAWVLGFNKKIQEEYKVDDLYALVNSGEWTYAQMNEIMLRASADLDGDGIYTAADQFGATAYAGVAYALLTASGETLIKRDSSNLPYYNGISDRFIGVYDAIVDMMFDNTDGAVFMDGKIKGLTGEQTWHDMFIEGRTLFYCEVLGSLKKLRQMDNEFGIIPFPKYDEVQADYSTLTASYAACLGIPVTNPDTDRTGVILDNLSAESYRTVRSVYYDILLEGKYIRDEESSAMLDIIFADRRFMLEQVFSWGGLTSAIINAASAKKTEIASTIAAVEEKVNSDIANTVAYYQS